MLKFPHLEELQLTLWMGKACRRTLASEISMQLLCSYGTYRAAYQRTTNKNFTNHSIRKTTVCKLQKAGISNDKIAAITWHKNEHGLHDHASVDLDNLRKLSNILSSVSARTPLTELHQNINHTSSSVHGSSQFSFHNCTVHFYGAPNPAKKPKRIIIDSDED